MINRLVSVLIFVLALVATPVLAQDLPTGDSRNSAFREHFQKIVAANPTTSDFQKMQPGAVYRLPDGTTDELRSGDSKGIWGREFEKWYGIPYEDFLERNRQPDEPPVKPLACPDGEVGTPPNCLKPYVTTTTVTVWPWWLMPLALAFLALLVFAWSLYNSLKREGTRRNEAEDENAGLQRQLNAAERERELNRNPVTSGPPMVPNGVTQETAPAALQAVAARQYADETGNTPTTITQFEIIEQVRGRGYGVMQVSYRGVPAANRRLNGDIVYRAVIRYPNNGEVREVYMLQGCGNDLRYSGASYTPGNEFRFEPDTATESAVAPQQLPAAPVAAVVPMATPAPTAQDAVRQGDVRLEVRPADGDRPRMIRITGGESTGGFSVDVGDGLGDVVLRVFPRRQQ